jgi:cold shock CspA family protein
MWKGKELTSGGEQPGDLFYHGVISKIFWRNETGVIHSDTGKDVPFAFPFVTLLGVPRQDIQFLREGMRVGFDVNQTSKGLRVSVIKIYEL